MQTKDLQYNKMEKIKKGKSIIWHGIVKAGILITQKGNISI